MPAFSTVTISSARFGSRTASSRRAWPTNCTYYIRSCDFMRHFRDDVYMAARLTQWVCSQLDPNRGSDVSWPQPGSLTMHVGSFHVFAGDKPILEHRRKQRVQETLLRGGLG